MEYFNSRDPYGPRSIRCEHRIWFSVISIHATHTGRDSMYSFTPSSSSHFNSRDPYGPRFCQISKIRSIAEISIHATHTGRDNRGIKSTPIIFRFQFTRPIRAAIVSAVEASGTFWISIHATHTGRDMEPESLLLQSLHFNSRDPYGPRSGRWLTSVTLPNFNSRDPYGPRLQRISIYYRINMNFNSRDPYGPRSTAWGSQAVRQRTFQFTRPIRAAIAHLLRGHRIVATHTGRDLCPQSPLRRFSYFNSRDPYGPRCPPARDTFV